VGVPPPPPFQPDEGDGFTAPPLWEKGHPVEPRALSFTGFIDTAFNLYKLHWRGLMGIVALLVVPLQFVSEYLTRNYQRAAIFNTQAPAGQSGRLAVISGVLALITLLVVQPLLTAGVVRAVVAFHLGESPSAGEIIEQALSLVGRMLAVILLMTLAIVGGLILLVIPGLIFVIRFSVSPSAAVVEGVRGSDALRRSWELTKGHFWRIVGITVVAGVLAAVVSSLIAIPAAVIANNMDSGGWVVRAVGSSLGQLVTTPFVLMVGVLIYLDLRVRKDGLTLDRLSQEAARP
jgi:hypothetical protein